MLLEKVFAVRHGRNSANNINHQMNTIHIPIGGRRRDHTSKCKVPFFFPFLFLLFCFPDGAKKLKTKNTKRILYPGSAIYYICYSIALTYPGTVPGYRVIPVSYAYG